MAGGIGLPEHDPIEIDRLGFGAPIAIKAEARLRIDVGRAVAADAVDGIAHRSAIGPAMDAVEPEIGAAGRVLRRVEPDMDRGPSAAGRRIDDAKSRPLDRGGA